MLFLLFLVIFNNFSTIPVVIENEKLKLTLAIPTVAPITVPNDAIDIPPLVADKTIKGCGRYIFASLVSISNREHL